MGRVNDILKLIFIIICKNQLINLRNYFMKSLFIFLFINASILICQIEDNEYESLYNFHIDSLETKLANTKIDTNYVNLLNELVVQLDTEDSLKAIKYGLLGAEIAKKIEWKKGEIKCFMTLSDYYYLKLTDYSKQIFYLTKALDISKELDNYNEYVVLLKEIGDFYKYNQENLQKSLKYYLKALKFSKKIEDKSLSIIINRDIGYLYTHTKLQDYQKALKYYTKALNISNDLDKKNEKALTLQSIASLYGTQFNTIKQLLYLQKALLIFENIRDTSNISFIIMDIANIYIHSNYKDYSKALEYFKRYLLIKNKTNHNGGYMYAISQIAKIYKEQKNYTKALEHEKKLLKIRKESGDRISGSLMSIGSIYKDLLNYKKALEYYQRAYNEDNNEINICTSSFFLGEIYELQLDYTKAIEYYHKAYIIYNKYNEKNAEVLLLLNLGKLYQKLSQDSVLSSIKNETKLVSLKKDLNLNKSNEYFRKTIELLKELLKEPGFRFEYYNYLSEAYKFIGNYKKAYSYLIKYKTITDSLFTIDKSKEIGKIEAKFEIEQSLIEEENKIKEQERILNEANSRRDLLQFSGVSIFTVLIFILIFYISKKNFSISLIDTLAFLAFLLTYEFILVFADPYIDSWSKGIPIYKLLMNFSIALLFIPFHRLEFRFKNKLIGKNNVSDDKKN